MIFSFMYDSDDGSLYAAGICGLFRVWSEEDRATLEEGCDDYDPCDGECGEYQVNEWRACARSRASVCVCVCVN